MLARLMHNQGRAIAGDSNNEEEFGVTSSNGSVAGAVEGEVAQEEGYY